MASAAWCCACGVGIISMLVIYGILQERIMSIPYGHDYFTVSVFLVLCNRVAAIVFAMIMIYIKGEPFRNIAPLWKYIAISFSNVAASTCQYDALKFVSFPVQMLGKSFKMMPVMCWGMAISRKRYPPSDWLVALVVTLGVSEFLISGSISSYRNESSSFIGLLYLVAFVAFDGFTSTFQEKLFEDHKTSKYNQMLYINLGSAVVAVGSMLITGSYRVAWSFCCSHPAVLQDAFYLSVAAVSAQWFIYTQVKDFGALVLAATMNVRQLVSVLMSYWMFEHAISSLQALSLLCVFLAVFYKGAFSLLKSEEHEALLSRQSVQSDFPFQK
eukprot:CAMPEP_0170625888 /NCGR_PEP_ID=MMETSP0224-20130122/31029_1 /TAXON_ID=285029 /ORGANISM="Togula jolla, Strain CCCM 725" /LENGTH=327 /DNA_ID=CAMNT_0010952553 /DNA_START=43 /DNA_END=1023 /DNA_ORIENTATION=+